MRRLKVLHVASEVVGFAKTGGLADVAGSLPRALAHNGHECAILLPLYRCVTQGKVPLHLTDHMLSIPIGPRFLAGRLWRATLPDSEVPVFLIEQPELFERDDPAHGRGLYQYTLPTGQKRDYPDNCDRFIVLCRAALEAIRLLDFWPDVIHNHDWQAGLVPVYLQEVYRKHPEPALRSRYQSIHTLFTIHNIAYQGVFRAQELVRTGLDWKLFNYHQLEYYGQLNFLKAGIVFSDRITTVSPRYAEEIQTPYYGCGLQGVLLERRSRLTGIVNGVDYRVWDPAHDSHLAQTYDADTVTEGKPACKAALQRRYNLPERPRISVLGMISRLVEQKGVELVGQAAQRLLASRPDAAQLIVLGEGDPVYHRMLLDLQARFPDRVGLTLGFDESLAHQIEAGADIYLMPSQFEPSGLNQLYSLKYGTVPVVRVTGGLADTIVDCTAETLANGSATGFRFIANTASAFLEALHRALDCYHNDPASWLQLVRTGMSRDWSWERSAAEYEKQYLKLVSGEW
jgi:starch synthase